MLYGENEMRKNLDTYLFFTFAIPHKFMSQILKEDNFPAIQTDKFIWNIIRGIEDKENEFIYISSRPVSDYPYYAKKFIGKNIYVDDVNNKKIKILEIPFCNISFFKVLSRFFSGFYYAMKEFSKKNNKKGVIIYSVTVPYLALGCIFSKIFKIQLIGIWTDPPSVENVRDGLIKSKLRKIELTLSKFFMKKFDKVISLTKQLAEDFCPDKPYLVIEGILNPNIYTQIIGNKRNEEIKTIVYTGTLEEKYGIKNIIKSFKYIDDKNVELHIYGKGNYEFEINKSCKEDSRIKYFGLKDNKEILNIQKNASFLINARSTEDEYVKYSFPSKMIEYMASGTPVITTILYGFPKEYEKYLIPLENNYPKTIAKKLLEVSKWSFDEKQKFGKNAQIFIQNKSYDKQGKKIRRFIKE